MAAARNTGTLIDKAGTRMLDLIVGTTSQAATGRPLKNSSGVVESRDPLLPRQPGGVSVSAAQKMVDRVTANLPGASDVAVRVVENRLDVEDAEGHLPSMGSEGIYFPSRKDADGRVVPARIYLMASQLPTMARAEQVLAHELVGDR